MHRYRDNVPEIQEDVLRALSRWICFSPFAMLRDKYIKYFGWVLSFDCGGGAADAAPRALALADADDAAGARGGRVV